MRLRPMGPTLLLLAVLGCGEATGPDAGSMRIEPIGGNDQVGAPGALLDANFVVRVTSDGEPVENASIEWELVVGTDARITPTSSLTTAEGFASARLRLGHEIGRYEVHARVVGESAEPAVFEARAIRRPVVAAVSPTRVTAGDVVTITGEYLSEEVAERVVLFDGWRGTVIQASPTRIEAVVPACIPTRTAEVRVRVGSVESATSAHLDVIGDGGAPIDLAPGGVLSLDDPAAMSCVRLPAVPGAAYMAVQQNVSDRTGQVLPYQLLALAEQKPGTVASLATRERVEAEIPVRMSGPGPGHAQAEWETRLRVNERRLGRAGTITAPAHATVPRVGDRRTFKVYNRQGNFSDVTAEVMHVSEHAVLYQDIAAPPGGLTAEDFAAFGALFDDPIYTTQSSVFGAPSDVDGNGRVIVLFTPVVNELTPATSGSGGYIAGFFYGIDLQPRSVHENSNEAEIFYSIVPDPAGHHGGVRTRENVLRVVPPVLAHELQHMIHFEHRRKAGRPQEVLWLSEGLAHMAEELIAAEFERRGDLAMVTAFRRDNYERAFRYLQAVDRYTLIEDRNPGTLEGRGAQWLFVLYLSRHFGEGKVLRALTQSKLDGVENVVDATKTPWAELFARWSLALWADGAPELEGVAIDPVYTFRGFNLRREIAGSGRFPLQPADHAFADLWLNGTLPASAPFHMLFEAGDASAGEPPPLHLSFGRPRGASFHPDDRPRWTILRIR